MALIKELSFTFNMYFLKPEVFCKVSKYNQIFIEVVESKKYHQEQNISLLSTIIPKNCTKEDYSYILY